MAPIKYFSLAALILVSFAVVFGVMYFAGIWEYHLGFGVATVLFFIAQSTIVYLVGERLARSSNKQSYSSLIIVNIMLKVLGSIILVIAYLKFFDPMNNLFVWLFIPVYLVFTVFEAYFMTIQAKYR